MLVESEQHMPRADMPLLPGPVRRSTRSGFVTRLGGLVAVVTCASSVAHASQARGLAWGDWLGVP